jgi:hypothetical protein
MVLEIQNRYIAKAIAKFRVIIHYLGYDIAVTNDEAVVYEHDSNNNLFTIHRGDGEAIRLCMGYIENRNRSRGI